MSINWQTDCITERYTVKPSQKKTPKIKRRQKKDPSKQDTKWVSNNTCPKTKLMLKPLKPNCYLFLSNDGANLEKTSMLCALDLNWWTDWLRDNNMCYDRVNLQKAKTVLFHILLPSIDLKTDTCTWLEPLTFT